MEVNGAPQLFGSKLSFFKRSSFCVQQKKETYSGLQQLEGE